MQVRPNGVFFFKKKESVRMQ